MEKRHKYEYQVDANANTAGAHIVRMVGSNKRVLEIGAGPGAITKLLKEHNNCLVTAVEIDKKAIEKLTPYCEKVYSLDLNDESWISHFKNEEKYNAIVGGDVLEHLYDPWNVLKAMSEVLHDDGHIVLSIPHVGHNVVIACLLEEDFAYQDWGLLDKTHIRFFGIHNIQKLFNDAGFKIIEAEFVVTAPELTEFSDRWRRLSPEIKHTLSSNKFGQVYQVVIKAKPDTCSEKGIDLYSLPVPKASFKLHSSAPLSKKMVHKLKLIIFPYLSFKNRMKLTHFITRLGFKF